jgi:hypothetical protein
MAQRPLNPGGGRAPILRARMPIPELDRLDRAVASCGAAYRSVLVRALLTVGLDLLEAGQLSLDREVMAKAS